MRVGGKRVADRDRVTHKETWEGGHWGGGKLSERAADKETETGRHRRGGYKQRGRERERVADKEIVGVGWG